MFIHCSLMLLFLSCVKTTDNVYGDAATKANDFNRFSFWPSVHNGATLLRKARASPIQELETSVVKTGSEVAGPNEGLTDAVAKPTDEKVSPPAVPPPTIPSPAVPPTLSPSAVTNNAFDTKQNITQANQKTALKVPVNKTDATTLTPLNNATSSNATSTEKPKALDLNNPGVVKRGFIVFGGFALMAVAYFLFYRRKNKNNDMSNALGMNDANQFRYGVLENEDMKDNLESSRIPLTMESEDEIDDDLEIFDLMQKKKSLSYVNLQQNDEEIVLSPREVDIEGSNLLLDIEDASSDTLINWSNNATKSIL